MRIRTTAMVVVLFAAWALGLALSITAGGAIHLLPALALFVLASQLMARKRKATSTSYARWLASKGADR
jgi:F0F1-type ATP synthase assembly protein I